MQTVPESNIDTPQPILGRITFNPLIIQIYSSNTSHKGHERFTLAHELAHYYLDHGRYLFRESCDDNDFVFNRSADVNGSAITRMEFQANYLVASLLMPRTHISFDFYHLLRLLQITNKGFGPLYIDNQPCNVSSFNLITDRLMQKYGVSRTAVKIRLEPMGLLRDARNFLLFAQPKI